LAQALTEFETSHLTDARFSDYPHSLAVARQQATFGVEQLSSGLFRLARPLGKNALLVLPRLSLTHSLTVTALARRSGLNVATVRGVLKKLQGAGLILIEMVRSEGRGRPCSAYLLHPDAEARLAELGEEVATEGVSDLRRLKTSEWMARYCERELQKSDRPPARKGWLQQQLVRHKALARQLEPRVKYTHCLWPGPIRRSSDPDNVDNNALSILAEFEGEAPSKLRSVLRSAGYTEAEALSAVARSLRPLPRTPLLRPSSLPSDGAQLGLGLK
jgi:DNA-binding transcriptional ArsR family regulator